MAKRKAFSKAKLGTGGRFAACVAKVLSFYRKKGRSITTDRAKAICASIGRKAYGKKAFQALAVRARRRKR